MARKYTNKILERIDDGQLHPDFLIQNLLMWMSEAEVKEFYERVIDCDDEEDDGDIHDRARRDGRGEDEE